MWQMERPLHARANLASIPAPVSTSTSVALEDFEDYFGILPPPHIVIHSMSAKKRVLEDLRPKFVVIYDPDIGFFRKLEVRERSGEREESGGEERKRREEGRRERESKMIEFSLILAFVRCTNVKILACPCVFIGCGTGKNGFQIITFFLVFFAFPYFLIVFFSCLCSDSVEEKRYIKGLGKEQEAFENLIYEKSVCVFSLLLSLLFLLLSLSPSISSLHSPSLSPSRILFPCLSSLLLWPPSPFPHFSHLSFFAVLSRQ